MTFFFPPSDSLHDDMNSLHAKLDKFVTYELHEFVTCELQPIAHLERHLISISNLNLLGVFSTERGKRDLEN